MAAFAITHTTTYTYTLPVFLEPHTFRLRPRCDAAQILTRFEFDIRPQPTGATQSTDLDGNVVVHAWFAGVTESLAIKTNSTVITQRFNPFDYILTDQRGNLLPMSYTKPSKDLLAAYSIRAIGSPLVDRFANSIAEQAEWKRFAS
jgi:transglutaminase-like putative cysteine protease